MIEKRSLNTSFLNKKRPYTAFYLKKISSVPSKHLLKDSDRKKALDLFDKGLEEIKTNRKDFHLTLSHSSSSDQEKIALYLKHQWERIFGIKITLRKDDWNGFHAKVISGDYEIGASFNSNLYDDPSYLMEFFEYSGNNYSKWENPDYQKYFSLAKQSSNKNQRTLYLQKAEKILMDEMPVIPIYNHAHLYVCNDQLVNFSTPRFNYADFKWAYFENEL